MKVIPVTSPAAIQPQQESEQARTARMTEKYTQILAKQSGTPQETPVANPSAVSVEELSAIRPKSPLDAVQAQEQGVQEEHNITEESAPEVTEPAKRTPDEERRFQQLARQERALRAKFQQQSIELKKRETAIAAREAAVQNPAAPDYTNYVPKERIQQDALSVLEEAGVSWDELTNQVVNRQPTDPRVNAHIAKLEAQLAKLEKANETSTKNFQDQQTAQYQAAVKQIRADAKQLVYTDPEFETIKTMNAVNDVVELIEQTYKKDGVVLSVEEAAKEVENYLVDEALKFTQIGKIQKRMAAANASRTPTETKTQSSQQPQMKTLTNAASSTRPLTVRERAIAAAEGRLKP